MEQFDEEKMINENDLFQLQTNWLPIMEGENEDSSSDFDSQTRCISNRHLSKLSKSDGESSSNSPESSLPLSSQGSGSGYLDSDLVKAAIERLNFDDSEVTIVLPSQKIHNIRVISLSVATRNDHPFCIFQASPNASTRSSSFSVNSPASPSEYESRSEQVPNCRKYNIALTEFETGMTYNMEGLYVSK